MTKDHKKIERFDFGESYKQPFHATHLLMRKSKCRYKK